MAVAVAMVLVVAEQALEVAVVHPVVLALVDLAEVMATNHVVPHLAAAEQERLDAAEAAKDAGRRARWVDESARRFEAKMVAQEAAAREEENLPFSHAVQSEAEVPAEPLYLPAAQARQEEDPEEEYVPAAQEVQSES